MLFCYQECFSSAFLEAVAKALMIWLTYAFPLNYVFDSKTNKSQIDILYCGCMPLGINMR
jgi:hypothetical protein